MIRSAAEIHSISATFLQDNNAWIWIPERADFFVSINGRDFAPVGTVERKADPRTGGVILENFACGFSPRPVRYVKVKTKSVLRCPPWHKGAGGKAWLFIDEIVID